MMFRVFCLTLGALAAADAFVVRAPCMFSDWNIFLCTYNSNGAAIKRDKSPARGDRMCFVSALQ